MKKLLKVLLCLFLAATLFIPKTQVNAEGEYPDIENIRVDTNGIMTWDAFPGAEYYDISIPGVVGTGPTKMECQFDLQTFLATNGLQTGAYQVQITAFDEGWATIARSTAPSYDFTNDNQCPNPTNVRWDGNIVRWDCDADEEFDYLIRVYEEGESSWINSISTGSKYADVTDFMMYKDVKYVASVQTYRYKWANSDEAFTADSRPGRFTIQGILLTLDGETAEFKNAGGTGAFTDDEGNPPAKYYLNINGGGMSWGGQILHSPFNVKDAIIQAKGETGHYEISGYAMTEYWYRLSEDSNIIEYDFTKPGEYINVYFQAPNGYIRNSDTVIAVKGQTIAKPEEPEPDWGYLFTGKWYTDEACTNEWDFTKPVTEEMTLYAGFKEITYQVAAIAYPAEGGKVSINGSEPNSTAGPITVSCFSSYTNFSAQANEGYAFTGWRKNSPDGELYQEWPEMGEHIEEDITYYAVFAKGYKVAYYGNEGKLDEFIADAGSKITLPEYTGATPPGMQFECWEIYDTKNNVWLEENGKPGDTITVNTELEIYTVFVPVSNYVKRLSGKLRYDTSLAIANEFKASFGLKKFNYIVLATGENFADALGGGYLAAYWGAPIILTKPSQATKINKYINDNLYEYGTIYVLGGKGAVPEECLAGLNSTFEIRRLSGKDRYETNLLILNEVDSYYSQILVCSGRNYADALAASATGRPLLLVDTKKNTLSVEQKEYLAAHPDSSIYIIGGEGAVSKEIENELKAYGNGMLKRLSGSGRYETSAAIAEEFFSWSSRAILAYSHEFPDGLCAGPLGYYVGAPILLTKTGKEAAAQTFCSENHITNGYVTGGAAKIPDDTAKYIFNVTEIK